jgi:mannose-6-phosphate isomerase-like protein (cupin superfamily)
MQKLTVMLLSLLAFATVLLCADPEGFAMYTSAEMKNKMSSAKLDEHKVGVTRVATWGNHGLLAIRREGDGEAEVHETQVDVIFVVSGEGTLVIGGTVVDPHNSAAGEIRGTSIKGGVNKKMAPGDVFHIPAKVPHQMLVPKMISFEVVKVDTK